MPTTVVTPDPTGQAMAFAHRLLRMSADDIRRVASQVGIDDDVARWHAVAGIEHRLRRGRLLWQATVAGRVATQAVFTVANRAGLDMDRDVVAVAHAAGDAARAIAAGGATLEVARPLLAPWVLIGVLGERATCDGERPTRRAGRCGDSAAPETSVTSSGVSGGARARRCIAPGTGGVAGIDTTPGNGGRRMGLHELARRIGDVEGLDRGTGPLVMAAKKLIPAGRVKDVLSGSQLGHPLHPALTDVPIGSFTAATLLDLVGGEPAEGAVGALLAIGIVATLPTASAGLADWSDTYGSEQRIGLVHAVANVAALSLFAGSLVARRGGRRGLGRLFGLAGQATMLAGGYLGGHLSYARGVGVNNAFYQHEPQDWTAVMDVADLQAGSPTKVEADGATVLLYRSSDRIYAIGSRCSHAGGPLQEGKIDDGALCVECPWHGSVFRLEDGDVVHGPASIPQAAYDVRVQDGRIEIRARR